MRKPKKGKAKTPDQILLENAQRRAAQRDADTRMDWGISPETIMLAAKRGEEIVEFPVRPGEREKPPKRLSGLEWLWGKGRITVRQMGAGLKYGDIYRLANDVPIRSASNYDRMGGDGTTSQEVRMDAFDKLRECQIMGLRNHPGMIDLCNNVAGEGHRIRDIAKGDDKVAQTSEATLVIALDLLSTYYGM